MTTNDEPEAVPVDVEAIKERREVRLAALFILGGDAPKAMKESEQDLTQALAELTRLRAKLEKALGLVEEAWKEGKRARSTADRAVLDESWEGSHAKRRCDEIKQQGGNGKQQLATS